MHTASTHKVDPIHLEHRLLEESNGRSFFALYTSRGYKNSHTSYALLFAWGAQRVFGADELAARCRTLLKRGRIGLQEKVSVGPLEVHLLLRQVTLSEKPVELSPREFALLCALLMPPGMVRSRQELLRMAWPPFSGGPRSVDTQVLTLRRKLEQAGLGDGGGITTVRQQGYRFSVDNL